MMTPGQETIHIPASIEYLEQTQKRIKNFAKRAGCSSEIFLKLDLVVEELNVNISNYAYPDEMGQIKISCSVSAISSKEKILVIEFTDWGLPFNPLAQQDVDVDAGMDQREPGGLGILLTTQLCEQLSYTYKNNSNILTLSIKCTE